MKPRDKALDRIKPFIVNTDECIDDHNLPLNKNNYVVLQYKTFHENGDKYKLHIRGHRLSYEYHNNVDLKSDDIICHICDNPSCINPKHLFRGDHNDNVQDKVEKNRQAKGKDNGRYKHGYFSKYTPEEKPEPDFNDLFSRSLTIDEVKYIKKKIKNRSGTLKELSEDIGIKYQTIRDISCGRTYKSITID